MTTFRPKPRPLAARAAGATAVAAFALVSAHPAAAAGPALLPAETEVAAGTAHADDRGRRVRCNGGGSCCDQHPSSDACQPASWCLDNPYDTACAPG